ncbi:MAG: glycosyltransferase [Thermoleophilaceae bacterium]
MRPAGNVLAVTATAYLVALCLAIVAYKAVFVEMVLIDPFFAIYGLTVCGYILSRFLLSLFYRPGKGREAEHEPTVAVVMPAFNEEDAIARSVHSLLDVDYPHDRLEVIVVDDGSTDGTAEEIERVAAQAGDRVHVISFGENRGKRAAMAAGMRATDAEILAFVDSDSMLEEDALRTLVQGFADPDVGAICGHADVQNTRESWLTRMQAVRYFVAFRVLKAAESIFNAVTCCSGCFAAYRAEAILPHLGEWEHQRFLGRPATFGDDRSLTNFVLRDWKVRYDSEARSHTIVPSSFQKFLTQQMRWKRSWTRESLIVGGFIWRKHPIASISTYVSIVLPLLAPIVVARALWWRPVVEDAGAPFIYLLGIYVLALVYGLYYAIRTRRYDDTLWVYGVIFVFFYLVFLVWQTYWAVLTANRSTWGTRPSTHGAQA